MDKKSPIRLESVKKIFVFVKISKLEIKLFQWFQRVRRNLALVQMAGIEPARSIQPQDFKSCASTSSATSAYLCFELVLPNDISYYNM